MTVLSIAAALAIGFAAGVGGRLVLCSGGRVPAWVLMAVGVAAALAGAVAARLIGVDTSRLGSTEIGLEIVAATVAVTGAAGVPAGSHRRQVGPGPVPRGHGARKRSGSDS